MRTQIKEISKLYDVGTKAATKKADQLYHKIKGRLSPKKGGEGFIEGLDTARNISDSPGSTFFRDLSQSEMSGI